MSRDSKVIIICQGSRTIRARYGINSELLHKPSLEIQAKVGLTKQWLEANPDKEPQIDDYVVGQALQDAERASEIGRITWPIKREILENLTAAAALW